MNIQIRSAVRGGAKTAAVGGRGGDWQRITEGLRCAARIETRLTGSVGHEKTYSSLVTLMTNDTPDAAVNPSRQFGLDLCKHTYKKKGRGGCAENQTVQILVPMKVSACTCRP